MFQVDFKRPLENSAGFVATSTSPQRGNQPDVLSFPKRSQHNPVNRGRSFLIG
jgi:hypothetical protein